MHISINDREIGEIELEVVPGWLRLRLPHIFQSDDGMDCCEELVIDFAAIPADVVQKLCKFVQLAQRKTDAQGNIVEHRHPGPDMRGYRKAVFQIEGRRPDTLAGPSLDYVRSEPERLMRAQEEYERREREREAEREQKRRAQAERRAEKERRARDAGTN